MSIGLVASSIAISGFAWAMVYSALKDVLTMTVSNRLVVALLGGFSLLAPLAGWSLHEMATGAAAALLTLFVCVGFFAMGWLGGGDGKLLSVSVLWIGAEKALEFLFWTAIAGGVFALVLLALRRLPLPASLASRPWASRLHTPDAGVPFAVAIGFAGILILPATAWMAAFAR